MQTDQTDQTEEHGKNNICGLFPSIWKLSVALAKSQHIARWIFLPKIYTPPPIGIYVQRQSAIDERRVLLTQSSMHAQTKLRWIHAPRTPRQPLAQERTRSKHSKWAFSHVSLIMYAWWHTSKVYVKTHSIDPFLQKKEKKKTGKQRREKQTGNFKRREEKTYTSILWFSPAIFCVCFSCVVCAFFVGLQNFDSAKIHFSSLYFLYWIPCWCDGSVSATLFNS